MGANQHWWETFDCWGLKKWIRAFYQKSESFDSTLVAFITNSNNVFWMTDTVLELIQNIKLAFCNAYHKHQSNNHCQPWMRFPLGCPQMAPRSWQLHWRCVPSKAGARPGERQRRDKTFCSLLLLKKVFWVSMVKGVLFLCIFFLPVQSHDVPSGRVIVLHKKLPTSQ